MTRSPTFSPTCLTSFVVLATALSYPAHALNDAIDLASEQAQGIYASYDAETQLAFDQEISTCGSTCSVEVLPDGTLTIVEPSQHDSVGVSTAAPPSTYTPPSTAQCLATNPTIVKEGTAERNLGNDMAGLGLRVRASSFTEPVSTGGRRYAAHTEQAIQGKLLWHTFDLARTDADTRSEANGTFSTKGRVLARSTSNGTLQTVQEQSSTAQGDVTLPRIGTTRTFFRGSASYPIGPFSVSISGTVRGDAYYDVTARAVTAESRVRGNPNAGLYATASASLDALIAAVGADAALDILKGEMPVTARMARNPTTLGWDWHVEAKTVITALKGHIKGWVRLGVWIFSHTWRKTLVSWSGFVWSTTFFDNSGSDTSCSTSNTTPPPPPADYGDVEVSEDFDVGCVGTARCMSP